MNARVRHRRVDNSSRGHRGPSFSCHFHPTARSDLQRTAEPAIRRPEPAGHPRLRRQRDRDGHPATTSSSRIGLCGSLNRNFFAGWIPPNPARSARRSADARIVDPQSDAVDVAAVGGVQDLDQLADIARAGSYQPQGRWRHARGRSGEKSPTRRAARRGPCAATGRQRRCQNPILLPTVTPPSRDETQRKLGWSPHQRPAHAPATRE